LKHRILQDTGTSINIKKEGGIIPIYTPQLASILTTNEISAWNRTEQQKDQFNGVLFNNKYIEGFFKGEEYFEKEYRVSPDTLYGLHAQQYVRDLHDQYYHIGKNEFTGWNYARKSYPLVINNYGIKDFGYYSSLVHQIDELKRKHGNLFKTYAFEKCIKNGKFIRDKEPKADLSFKNLFKIEKFIDPCVDVLRQIDPPFLGNKLNFIGNLKGAICVWIDELKRLDIIHNHTDEEYAAFLNYNIDNLNMTKDGSLCRKENLRAEKLRKDFKILLSQLSQKER